MTGDRLIVAPDAMTVGREVRRIVDEGGRVAGFVGDIDADCDVLDEFLRDLRSNR